MFQSVEELSHKLSETGYFIDPTMTKVVFLADQMKKPLLLEGPAGSGKTMLALAVAQAAGTHVERLQCYRGVSEGQAIGRFDESLQRLYMEYAKGQHASWKDLQTSLKGRDFFRAGPLMRALEYDKPCVLLIDELDKVDEGFEALLLEILSAWQLSIPEFGTVSARSTPFVVLTSNEERRLGEASKEAMDRLQSFCQAMNVKVDRFGRYLAVMKTRAAHCKQAAARYVTRAKRAENKIARTESMVLYYLESHDLQQLETDDFTFRRQKNSQDSVIVRNAQAVPPELNRYELKVDGPLYLDVVRALPDEMASSLRASVKFTEPSNTAIKLHFASGKRIDGVEVKRLYHLRTA